MTSKEAAAKKDDLGRDLEVKEVEVKLLHHRPDDEIDALPTDLRYNNFDLSFTIISILTYIFDLVSWL
jgi:hypothetical protein